MIAYEYWSYLPENPTDVRWDQRWIRRILEGSPLTIRHRDLVSDLRAPAMKNPLGTHGRIIVFPCGMYDELGFPLAAALALSHDLRQLDWSIVIATSDEGSSFPWHLVTLPENSKLWVMTPRPEKPYPHGTTFIGEGCPVLPPEPEGERTIDVLFRGQVNHQRRRWCVNSARQLRRTSTNVEIHTTEGFSKGLPQDMYLKELTQAKIVLCPSGARTQDSFRVFEALEAGCIPIVDGLRPDGGGHGYWEMIEMEFLPVINDWSRLWFDVSRILDNYEWFARDVMQAWTFHKEATVARNLIRDAERLQEAANRPQTEVSL